MNFPKVLDIAGQRYKIKYPYTFTERDDIFGRVDFARGVIWVTDVDGAGNKCSDDHAAAIFWHEVVHVIDRIYCLNGIGEEGDKEKMMDGIAAGIYQILKDNYQPLIPKKKQ